MRLSPRTEQVLDVLAEAVRIATGNPDATPRPGQRDLAIDMAAASDRGGGHHAGEAPTGSGKSLAALSVAAVNSVCYQQRTLVATESISLQSQYVTKDGPVVAEAARRVLGRPVSVAILKGWSNYACAVQARDTAGALGAPTLAAEQDLRSHAERVRQTPGTGTVSIDGVDYDRAGLRDLTAWALEAHTDDDLAGDKSAYPGNATGQEWSRVSISSSDCLGADCPLASICKPRLARQHAAEADIVVTNHTMLAIQAANNVPVIIGNTTLGEFRNIIVDEAHALPSIVRRQGQTELSAKRIHTVSKRVRSVSDPRDAQVPGWKEAGRILADKVESSLALRAGHSTSPVTLGDGDNPVEEVSEMVRHWVAAGQNIIVTPQRGDFAATMAANRAREALSDLVDDVGTLAEHRVGRARWIQPVTAFNSNISVQAAPVHVGSLLTYNCWQQEVDDGEGEAQTVHLAVCAISATLPEGFARDCGLKSQIVKYPSPFDRAYESSLLYIPRASDQVDIDALRRANTGQRIKFDTSRHARWARQHIVELTAANQGSALVLAATVSAGKQYVDSLRKAGGGWRIYSQWDYTSSTEAVSHWRDDPQSVLVGTRSLMTGVDAPGNTNTLVIVDRAPRSASNPVDDARVDVLTEALGDRWAADKLVYVSDASLLLEQAAGRLIRSHTDSGMVVVLDPRILSSGPFSYSAPVRKTYQNALSRFSNRTARRDKALAWLANRHRPGREG